MPIGSERNDNNEAAASQDEIVVDEVRSLVLILGGIDAIVGILCHSSSDLDLQAEACLALVSLCVDSEGACTALSTLAVSERNAVPLNQTGFMSLFVEGILDEKLYASFRPLDGGKEGEGSGGGTPLVILNMLAVNCAMGDELACTETMSTVGKFVLENLTTAEEAEWAISLLHSLTLTRGCADILVSSSCKASESSLMVLDQVTTIVAAFPESVALQERACCLFSGLYVLTKARHRPQNVLLGLRVEIELIARSLHNHPSQECIWEQACLALRNFCCVVPLSVIGCDDIFQILARTVEFTCWSMTSKEWSDVVQEHIIGLVWAFASTGKAARRVVASTESGIKVIMEVLRQRPNSESLQRESINALNALSSTSEAHLQIGTRDGINTILKCMEEYDSHEDMMERYISVLDDLCSNAFKIKINIIENDSSIYCIISCMMTYMLSAAIQTSACSTLSHLATTNRIGMTVASAGGIGQILLVMVEHGDNLVVLEKACEALAYLIPGTPSEILQGNNAVSMTISTMQTHPRAEKLQEMCIMALWHLVMKNTIFLDEIAESHKVGVIISAMQDHLRSEPVQLVGCRALWHMAASNSINAEIGQSSGIEAIMNGAMLHINSIEVQLEAIGGLQIMASNLSNKEKIRESGGVAMFVGAMWVHYKSATLQEQAFSALSNILINHVTNQVTSVSRNELEPAVAAMKLFPENESLQVHACVFIRNLTFSQSNLPLLRDCSLLVELLMSASGNFPEACSERVALIIDMIL